MESVSEKKAASGIATKVPQQRSPPASQQGSDRRRFNTSTFPTSPLPLQRGQELRGSAEGHHGPAGRDGLGDGRSSRRGVPSGCCWGEPKVCVPDIPEEEWWNQS